MSSTSVRQFSWDPNIRCLAAELSDTNGLGRVLDDACDLGLIVEGLKRTDDVVFLVTDEIRDREGELQSWSLTSTCGQFTMVLFND